MQSDSRTATFARIGRSYPRLPAQDEAGRALGGARASRRYWIVAGVVGLVAGLGLLGWLIGR
jgi:hypothetical protein